MEIDEKQAHLDVRSALSTERIEEEPGDGCNCELLRKQNDWREFKLTGDGKSTTARDSLPGECAL